jgi:hypothetical protein
LQVIPQPNLPITASIKRKRAPAFQISCLPSFLQTALIEVALRVPILKLIILPEQFSSLPGLVINHIQAIRPPVLIEILLVSGKRKRF